jgi:transposase
MAEWLVAVLAKLCDPRIKADQETMRKSLEGNRRAEHLRWPTAAHFVSWLGLCPDNDISGGKVLWRGARRTKNRAGTLFRMAACSLYREQAPIGDYLRRMKAKLGPAAGTTARAHKIAIIFNTMPRFGQDATNCARSGSTRDSIHKQAAQRGYKLVPLEAAA